MCICMCVYMCMYMCMCVYVCIMHLKIRGQNNPKPNPGSF